MKRILLAMFLFLILINPLLFGAERLTSLTDVDLISISARLKDGIVKVHIYYKNCDQDRLVFWKEGEVLCVYALYENTGNILHPQKGPEITTGYKRLTRYRQSFYIDISEGYLGKNNRAIIECEVDTGYTTLSASDDFSMN